MLDHHHRIGPARDDAASCDCGRGTRPYFERGRMSASDHLRIEDQPAGRAVAAAHSIGGAYRKSVDSGAVKGRHIGRRGETKREHTVKRILKPHDFAGKWLKVNRAFETLSRFGGRDDFKELLLAGRTAHSSQEIRARFADALVVRHGSDLVITRAPTGRPSLAAGTTIHPSAWASAASGKYLETSGSMPSATRRTSTSSVSPTVEATFAVKGRLSHDGSFATPPLSLVSICRPISSHTANAASSLPGISSNGPELANPKAAVSPGENAMPWAPTVPVRANACTASSRGPKPVPPSSITASTPPASSASTSAPDPDATGSPPSAAMALATQAATASAISSQPPPTRAIRTRGF